MAIKTGSDTQICGCRTEVDIETFPPSGETMVVAERFLYCKKHDHSTLKSQLAEAEAIIEMTESAEWEKASTALTAYRQKWQGEK